MSFQSTVLIVSSIILVLMLLVVTYLIYKQKNSMLWPPEVSQCPDYWKVVGTDKCENVLGLGEGKCMNADFSGADWKGAGGLKKKSEWAENCGVVWDGISNGRYKDLEEGPQSYGLGAATTGLGFLDKMFDTHGTAIENIARSTAAAAQTSYNQEYN